MKTPYNLAGMTTATTGTGGPLTLGTALPGLRTFSAAGVPNGAEIYYEIKDGDEREVCEGVYTASGTTLTRTTLGSTTGSALDLSGSAEVRIGPIDRSLRADNLALSSSVAGETDVQGALEALEDELPVPYPGYLYGLTLANNSTDATNDIDIAVGRAATDDGAAIMVLASGITKRLDAAWAVGTGNGGLDTGSIANTTYHVWLIRRSDTGVVDALFSTSATSPTMPTNYDQKRRIGSIMRESGAIVGFYQDGDTFYRNTPVEDVSLTTLSTTGALITMSVPTGVRVGWFGTGALATGSAVGVVFTSPGAANVAPNTNSLNHLDTDSAGQRSINSIYNIVTDTSAQIRYRSTTASVSAFWITTFGWVDTRGRLN